MNTRLWVTVITCGEDVEQRVPNGFQYVEQMFDEAGLLEAVGTTQTRKFKERMRVLQRALRRECGGRVGLRVLNPWTLRGTWFIASHRLRGFPCFVVAGRRYPLETPNGEIVEAARQALYNRETPSLHGPGTHD